MPLISVVIPTRNRSEYLLDSINVILENTVDADVIICDNSETDALHSLLTTHLKTGRVKYIFSKEKLSVVENFELAFTAATGDYVISIGDDDTIGPGIEEIAQWAKTNQIDAITSYSNTFLVSFYWPGVRSKYFGDAYASNLFINEFSGRSKNTNGIESLRQVAQLLGGGLGNMPRAYHGLVSRDLLERIRKRHGHLFGGVSPDIYSAALISSYCNRATNVDFPFVIPGASPSSTAGQGAERSDRGNIRTTEHTARFGENLVWDPRIPEFYSPHTVWAYSLCKALNELQHLNVSPNFSRLYARCFLYSRKHHTELFKAMGVLAQSEGKTKVTAKFAVSVVVEVLELLMRIVNRLSNPKAGGRALRSGPHKTISSAFRALNEHIKKKKIGLTL